MKIHNNLDEILKQGSKIKILRFLFTERDEHTGRRIARGINMSASSTHKTLQKLKSEGLIASRKKGNAILYKLRENNYIVKKLLGPLFKKERSIYDDIILSVKKNLFSARKEIVSIAVFGSVARGEETSSSDIDLVVITNDKHGKAKIDNAMDSLTIRIAEKFGAAISPYVLTKAEIKKKFAKKQTVIRSILDNNRLVYGEPIERILA